MQPLTATAANPPEDIEAVLGRFQAWSATLKPAVKTPHKSKDLPEGVRELSYKEALESSRYRWQARVQPREHEETTSEPPVATTQGSFDRALADALILPDKLSLSTAPPTPARSYPTEALTPSFNSVLEALPAEPDSSALALIWPAPPRNERQVSMSLRVAASEQALIKARASEAGLSVSAYLRQCALEVEKLRAQVHHTLALIEQRSEQSPARSLTAGQPPAETTQRGFLTRLRKLIFTRPTRLTLRA